MTSAGGMDAPEEKVYQTGWLEKYSLPTFPKK